MLSSAPSQNPSDEVETEWWSWRWWRESPGTVSDLSFEKKGYSGGVTDGADDGESYLF